MRSNAEEREDFRGVVAEWRSGVLRAQTNFEHAVTQHQRIIKEFDRALIESAEGAFVIGNANRAMAAALNEVVRTQRILTDLVLIKKVPSPKDDERGIQLRL